MHVTHTRPEQVQRAHGRVGRGRLHPAQRCSLLVLRNWEAAGLGFTRQVGVKRLV